jgi:hypothetical protein
MAKKTPKKKTAPREKNKKAAKDFLRRWAAKSTKTCTKPA